MTFRSMSATLALLASAAGPAAAGDWPVFRGDARMSGAAPAADLPDRLDELWTFACKDAVEGAPAVAGDTAFVASLDGRLYALALSDGKLKWKAELGPMKASPAVRDGKVFVGDVEGKFYCVDAAAGKKLWTFEAGGEITAAANFHAGRALVGSHDATLYCLNPDGTKAWDYKIDGPVNGAAAVVGDNALVAGCDSVLHVVDAATGKPVGTADIGGQAGATAAVADGTAFVGTMTNQVVAVRLSGPKKLWAFEPRRRAQPFYASAAVAGEFVVAGGRDKKVYALDRGTGKEVWNFVAEGAVDASPVVANGRVYVGCLSSGGEFYVLGLSGGKLLQQIDLGSGVSGSAAVAGDRLLVGTKKGVVYCLGRK